MGWDSIKSCGKKKKKKSSSILSFFLSLWVFVVVGGVRENEGDGRGVGWDRWMDEMNFFYNGDITAAVSFHSLFSRIYINPASI